MGLILHCIPSCSICPWLSNQIQFESSRFVRSDHPDSSPCARWATMCPKANGRRVLIHLPHGYVSYATWSIFRITLYTSRVNRLVGETPRSRTLRCKLPCSACCNPGTEWLAKRETVDLPGPQTPLSARRKMVTGSNDESELFRSYCAGQLRSRISSIFQRMAKWHMHGVAPFVTLLWASVSQGT
jgi:hypothetical protein